MAQTTLTSTLKIEAKDGAGPVFQKLRSDADGLGKSLSKLNAKPLSFGKSPAGNLPAMPKPPQDAIEQSIEYSKTSNALEAMAGQSKEQVADLQVAAKLYSEKYSKTINEVMNMFLELAKTGYSGDAIKGMAEGIIETSTGSGEDLNAVMKGMTSIISGFQMKTGTYEEAKASAKEVGDALMIGANESKASVSSIAEGLSKAAGILKTGGDTVQHAVAQIAHLSNVGENEIKSGTTLRSNFLRLMKPNAKMNEAFARNNMNIADYATLRDADTEGLTASLNSRAVKGMTGEFEEGAAQQAISAFVKSFNANKEGDVGTMKAKAIDDLMKSSSEDTQMGRNALSKIFDSYLASRIEGGINEKKLREDFKKKNVSVGDQGTILEGQHISRNLALNSDRVGEIERKIHEGKGAAERSVPIMLQGAYGAQQNLIASKSRAVTDIAESGGAGFFENLTNMFSGFISKLSDPLQGAQLKRQDGTFTDSTQRERQESYSQSAIPSLFTKLEGYFSASKDKGPLAIATLPPVNLAAPVPVNSTVTGNATVNVQLSLAPEASRLLNAAAKNANMPLSTGKSMER